jgi:lipopolysaccharide transport system permease protein
LHLGPYQNVHLLRELVKRDLAARFTGSVFGLAWAVLQPLSLILLYWFVFTYMVGGGPGRDNNHYVYFLIAGLVPWLAINEGIMRSTTAIVDNSSIVRRLAFRSELLIIVPNVSAIFFELIALALLVTALVLTGWHAPSWWVLPIALLLQFLLQVGFGLLLSITYVFFRDLTQIVGFALSIVFYLSPILYPVGGRFSSFFAWNPMTPLIGLFRSAIFSEKVAPLPAAGSIVFLLVACLVIFAAGIGLFRRTQPSIVDLL